MGLAGYKISANRDTGNSAPFSLPNNRNNKTKTISDNEEKSRHICKVHIAASQVLRTFYCRPDNSDKTNFLSMINLTPRSSRLSWSPLALCFQKTQGDFWSKFREGPLIYSALQKAWISPELSTITPNGFVFYSMALTTSLTK